MNSPAASATQHDEHGPSELENRPLRPAVDGIQKEIVRYLRDHGRVNGLGAANSMIWDFESRRPRLIPHGSTIQAIMVHLSMLVGGGWITMDTDERTQQVRIELRLGVEHHIDDPDELFPGHRPRQTRSEGLAGLARELLATLEDPQPPYHRPRTSGPSQSQDVPEHLIATILIRLVQKGGADTFCALERIEGPARGMARGYLRSMAREGLIAVVHEPDIVSDSVVLLVAGCRWIIEFLERPIGVVTPLEDGQTRQEANAALREKQCADLVTPYLDGAWHTYVASDILSNTTYNYGRLSLLMRYLEDQGCIVRRGDNPHHRELQVTKAGIQRFGESAEAAS